MPKPIYVDTTPDDSRWRWVTTVPESWRSLDPALISVRVMAVLNDALIGWNGSPAEISFGVYDGEPAIYFNTNADPSDMFALMAEPPPTPVETEIADATARLQSFRAGTYEGSTEELLADMVTVFLPTVNTP